MTPLTEKLCREFPRIPAADIEMALPHIMGGHSMAYKDILARVHGYFNGPEFAARPAGCLSVSPHDTEGGFDPLRRINALLERQPAPAPECGERYEALRRMDAT